MLVLRPRIGCSTKFQDNQAQANVGGKAINVSRHQLPAPGKKCMTVCSIGKWIR